MATSHHQPAFLEAIRHWMLRFLAWHYLFNGIQLEFNLSNFEVNPDIWNCGKKHKWTPNTWWLVDHQPSCDPVRLVQTCATVHQDPGSDNMATLENPPFPSIEMKKMLDVFPFPTIQNPLIQLLPNSSKQLWFVLRLFCRELETSIH